MYNVLTSLRGTKVFARSRSSGSAATSLLDAQGSALKDFTLQALLGAIGLLQSGHLDESESTRLLGVGIKHDLALLDLTVLGEKTSHIVLGEARVDAGDKQVRTGVSSTRVNGRTVSAALAIRHIGSSVQGTTVVGALTGGSAGDRR